MTSTATIPRVAPSSPPRHRATTLIVAVAAIVSITAGVAFFGGASRAEATVYEVARTRSAPGPLGAITVVGDSVLLGSVLWGPTLDDHLVAAGWGPVRVRAGVGDNARTTADRLRSWRAGGWDPDAVVVNLGANDAAGCNNNEQCAYDAIMLVVDAIGSGKRIWWPKVTDHPVNSKHVAFNRALDRVVSERSDFYTWDWPTVMYQLGMYAWDHIHQTAPGYRARSELMSKEITASLARGRQTGGPVSLPKPISPPQEMQPIGPIRVIDTRTDPPGRLRAGQTIEIDVSDDVPDGTTAVAVYVTAADPAAAGHLSAQPCNRPPSSSITNYIGGVNRGAVTITPLSSDKKFCVFTHAATDVVIDLQAAFVPDGGLRFDPLSIPERLIDTRDTAASRHLEIDVPKGAEAVAVNVTAVDGAQPGHATIHPCRDPVPTAANLNYLANEVVAAAGYVPVSPNGTICIDTHSLVDIVVDLTGTFEPSGALAYVPVVPTRTLDTRDGSGGWGPIHGASQVIEARVAPSAAEAVTGTITLVGPVRNSHLQTWGCGDRDQNSNVNAAEGAVLANFVTTGTSDGSLCIFAVTVGHTVFDTTGWWIR